MLSVVFLVMAVLCVRANVVELDVGSPGAVCVALGKALRLLRGRVDTRLSPELAATTVRVTATQSLTVVLDGRRLRIEPNLDSPNAPPGMVDAPADSVASGGRPQLFLHVAAAWLWSSVVSDVDLDLPILVEHGRAVEVRGECDDDSDSADEPSGMSTTDVPISDVPATMSNAEQTTLSSTSARVETSSTIMPPASTTSLSGCQFVCDGRGPASTLPRSARSGCPAQHHCSSDGSQCLANLPTRNCFDNETPLKGGFGIYRNVRGPIGNAPYRYYPATRIMTTSVENLKEEPRDPCIERHYFLWTNRCSHVLNETCKMHPKVGRLAPFSFTHFHLTHFIHPLQPGNLPAFTQLPTYNAARWQFRSWEAANACTVAQMRAAVGSSSMTQITSYLKDFGLTAVLDPSSVNLNANIGDFVDKCWLEPIG